MIVETEAYAGPYDKACHAYQWRCTQRTAPMFEEGGIAYVYLIYGIYNLFNIVTHGGQQPYAVLIRAIEPLEGLDAMLERRKMVSLKPSLSAGPGTLSQALGIDRSLSGVSLNGREIWLEDRGIVIDTENIVATTRVGVDYAGEDALLPYRFYIRNHPFVSKGKGLALGK